MKQKLFSSFLLLVVVGEEVMVGGIGSGRKMSSSSHLPQFVINKRRTSIRNRSLYGIQVGR
jgi:hypothetical protein